MDGSPDALLTRLALAGALVTGILLLARVRARRRVAYEPRIARLPADLRTGAPLTAFYFTSRLCSACLETPGIVREAAPDVPVVALHVHERPDLVRALGVFETPTLLLADGEGRIRYARVGNPTVDELRLYVAEAGWSSNTVTSPQPARNVLTGSP